MYLWRAGEIITADKLTPRILSGAEYMSFPDAVGNYYRGAREISFPDGFFRTEPHLALSGRSGVPGVLMEVSYQSKSVNGFTLYAARQTQTETWVDWIAIEVPEF